MAELAREGCERLLVVLSEGCPSKPGVSGPGELLLNPPWTDVCSYRNEEEQVV